jgi:hypothetical protein
MSSESACRWSGPSWKTPKLSSVPAGMAAGLIVMVKGSARVPDTTCEKAASAGCEEQKLPEVTSAGMPYC